MPGKTLERAGTFTLPIEILNRQNNAAESNGASKNILILLALESYLEDAADAEVILERIHNSQEEVISARQKIWWPVGNTRLVFIESSATFRMNKSPLWF